MTRRSFLKRLGVGIVAFAFGWSPWKPKILHPEWKVTSWVNTRKEDSFSSYLGFNVRDIKGIEKQEFSGALRLDALPLCKLKPPQLFHYMEKELDSFMLDVDSAFAEYGWTPPTRQQFLDAIPKKNLTSRNSLL